MAGPPATTPISPFQSILTLQLTSFSTKETPLSCASERAPRARRTLTRLGASAPALWGKARALCLSTHVQILLAPHSATHIAFSVECPVTPIKRPLPSHHTPVTSAVPGRPRSQNSGPDPIKDATNASCSTGQDLPFEMIGLTTLFFINYKRAGVLFQMDSW